jgi:TPP-dependent pyruvate/acetoin dehydrogenase alpha subunit
LPVIFVCEHNGYGEFTASDDVTAGRDTTARGAVFDIPSEMVDGMDVLAVQEAAGRAIARGRQGEGPSFLVCATYRFGGHHVGDKQEYKDTAEAAGWRQKDPIERFSRQLIDANVATPETLATLKQVVEAEVRDAVEFARAAAMPDRRDLEFYVYA